MKREVLLASAMVLVLGLTACGKGETDQTAPVQSVSALCGYGALGNVDRFAGVVTSRSQVEVEKNQEWPVEELKVKVGDEVTEGQVLFSYHAEKAKMELERSRLELQQLKNSLATKKEQKEQLEKDRKKASAKDKLSYTLEIQETEADILEAEYNIGIKEKEIEKAEESLKDLKVTAPVSGIIKTINENGDNNNMGMNEYYGGGEQSQAYIVIMETGNYRVKGYVNETNVGQLSEGMQILVRSRVTDDTWTGVLSNIDFQNAAQDNNNMYMMEMGGSDSEMTQSSKYPFYVELDSVNDLLMGQHVYIEPDYGQGSQETKEIFLSAGFINDIDGKAWVWAENSKGKLEKRDVSLGEHDLEMDTYVITKGLELTDYVAYPDDSLKAGMACMEYEDNFGDMGDMMDMGDMGDMMDMGEMGIMEESGMIEGAAVMDGAEMMENPEMAEDTVDEAPVEEEKR